jgi:RNA polymerase sigma factor (TIGR02999 family)
VPAQVPPEDTTITHTLETPRAGELTRLLRRERDGDHEAFDLLFSLAYTELRGVAERQLKRTPGDGALRPTELVAEVYLKLVDSPVSEWKNRAHFLGITARAMRKLLVDLARTRNAQRPGDRGASSALGDRLPLDTASLDDVLMLEDAVAGLDLNQRRIVEYRFFGGMSEDEIAHVLGISTQAVRREWVKARAWIYSALYPGRA